MIENRRQNASKMPENLGQIMRMKGKMQENKRQITREWKVKCKQNPREPGASHERIGGKLGKIRRQQSRELEQVARE